MSSHLWKSQGGGETGARGGGCLEGAFSYQERSWLSHLELTKPWPPALRPGSPAHRAGGVPGEGDQRARHPTLLWAQEHALLGGLWWGAVCSPQDYDVSACGIPVLSTLLQSEVGQIALSFPFTEPAFSASPLSFTRLSSVWTLGSMRNTYLGVPSPCDPTLCTKRFLGAHLSTALFLLTPCFPLLLKP